MATIEWMTKRDGKVLTTIRDTISKDGKTRTGTKVGVRALPDRIAHGRWGLEESIRVLDYLNEYYGVPYPLAKLDHIALQDFAAGAMENWAPSRIGSGSCSSTPRRRRRRRGRTSWT